MVTPGSDPVFPGYPPQLEAPQDRTDIFFEETPPLWFISAAGLISVTEVHLKNTALATEF